jgi:DNA gyrase subunit B
MDKKIIKEPIEMKYLMDGLYCIVSIKIPNAEFEGQTKTKLGNKEAQYAIETIMNDVFKKSVSNKENIPIFDAIVTRASKVKEAEEAARRARNISRQTKKINKIALPGKLAECGNKNGYRELFIVEGDSAAGCFVSSTKIRLADSRILTIAELVQEQNNGKQNYVFSIDDSGNFVIEPIKDVFKTKHVSKLCQVILDNDSILECTPDHPFMLQDMSYKQAKDLTMKDALMTVDIKENIHVISCNIIQKEEDVYDLSVPPYKNFILDAGVVVHNSAKEGRYREFQAILPLRGKILNVSKADIERILNSDVIKSLIASIGAGIGNKFNVEDVRYDKIVSMTDADIDGSHIRSLILTLFYYYMPGLIESGMVYSAQPPLYRIIKSDNTSLYLFDDSSLKEYQSKHKNEKYILGRFKGLGEMNPEQLCETTLDPKTRILRQITLDDAKDAAKSFEILMGKNAGLRRDFIDANSFKINIDDI